VCRVAMLAFQRGLIPKWRGGGGVEERAEGEGSRHTRVDLVAVQEGREFVDVGGVLEEGGRPVEEGVHVIDARQGVPQPLVHLCMAREEAGR